MAQKTIVVGVDSSETAREAARKAAGLAQHLGAQLVVISAYGKFEVERIGERSDEIILTTEQEALSTAENQVAPLRSEFPDLVLETVASEGKPAEALVAHAEKLEADLIVVGNKRVQGLARVLGSVAADVARKAHCDVYIVHTHDR